MDRAKHAHAIEVGAKLHLKRRGVITPQARELIRELVALGVPIRKVNTVIKALGRLTGCVVGGESVDGRSVRRIVLPLLYRYVYP